MKGIVAMRTAENEKSQQKGKKKKKGSQIGASALKSIGPIVLSGKDPELTEEQRAARRFGHGINVTAIGPKPKVRDPLWLSNQTDLPPASASITGDAATVKLGVDEVPMVSSPFSFGFAI